MAIGVGKNAIHNTYKSLANNCATQLLTKRLNAVVWEQLLEKQEFFHIHTAYECCLCLFRNRLCCRNDWHAKSILRFYFFLPRPPHHHIDLCVVWWWQRYESIHCCTAFMQTTYWCWYCLQQWPQMLTRTFRLTHTRTHTLIHLHTHMHCKKHY